MEVFLKQLKKDSRYADLPHQEKMVMWKNYKNLADEERIVETRGELGIQGPTINLNTCALDALERVPKLNLPTRKAIINKRESLPQQRFTSWDDVSSVAGVGTTVLNR